MQQTGWWCRDAYNHESWLRRVLSSRAILVAYVHNPCRIHRGLASAARKIPLDRRHALFGVALTPTPHLNASYTQFPRNLPVIFALRGQQYNPGAPGGTHARCVRTRQLGQRLLLSCCQDNLRGSAHSTSPVVNRKPPTPRQKI